MNENTAVVILDAVERLKAMVTELSDQRASNKRWYTNAEAMEYLGVGCAVLTNARNNAELPFYKRGKTIWYDKKDLDKFVTSGKVY